MSLIEGVGDEVVQFVAVVLVLVVSALAWWSTNARINRYRTVLVMRSRTHHPVTVSIRTNTSTTNSVEDSSRDNARVIPLQEMDSIYDADMAMLDNNRLHFYRRIDSPNNTQSAGESTSDESEVPEESEPASNAQIREMDSIVSAMEADVSTGRSIFSRSESNSTSSDPVKRVKKDNAKDEIGSSTPNVNNSEETGVTTANGNEEETMSDMPDTADQDARKILIKLKYLNDTLKEVEGSLDELLKDFKCKAAAQKMSM